MSHPGRHPELLGVGTGLRQEGMLKATLRIRLDVLAHICPAKIHLYFRQTTPRLNFENRKLAPLKFNRPDSKSIGGSLSETD